eukprot:TRINITY_DN1428_c0_g1_i2.p1 TRINITY_DN1428_c0_g1~~TRINITY_DN1428_c0_g1_i2.p1  ORF type:complete len:251 (+),score=30.83 TRINITY_DN1428_c0_g1_i2:151-903(+)
MENCLCTGCGFNIVSIVQSTLHAKFRLNGLVPEEMMLDEGRTYVHMWRPRIRQAKRLGSIVLLHGFGASAVFQWQDQISKLVSLYNVYVPDLIDDVADLLLPSGPSDVRKLMEVASVRPPPTTDWILRQTLDHMFRDMVEEKRELLTHLKSYIDDPATLHIPKLEKETLIVWGERDMVFPVELAHRLAAFLGARSIVEVMNNTAHLPNAENPRLYNNIILNFLRQPRRVPSQPDEIDNHLERQTSQTKLL